VRQRDGARPARNLKALPRPAVERLRREHRFGQRRVEASEAGKLNDQARQIRLT
jgi:hypothetical protein